LSLEEVDLIAYFQLTIPFIFKMMSFYFFRTIRFIFRGRLILVDYIKFGIVIATGRCVALLLA
jgi:hypothetical protein